LASQERDPRAYELMTVFLPDLTDEDSQAEIEKIEGLITAGDGTMTETLTTSPWGRRRLAYTIRFNGVDYRDGIYTVFHFEMAPSALAELEREMKLDTSLMRYLLVHDDPKAGEKFTGNEEGDEEGETDGAPASSEGGEAAGGATAAAVTEAPAETETVAVAESTEDSAEETEETPAEEAAADTAPAAAESAPVEEAPAQDTVTETAPPAADEAPAGEATDDESDKE
jgi:small subunit ribosomal protein S6